MELSKAKSGKLFEGIEDDKISIFISQIQSRGVSNDFDPFNFTWRGTGFESDLSNFFIDSFPSQFLRLLQDLYPKEVEVQKAADVAGKILSAPMKIDQLQRDNPLKMTEPWFKILTTHNVKEPPPQALEEVIRGVKNNLVKAAPNHRYENSDAQVLCQHLPNGKLVFHNTSAQILNKVHAQLNKEETNKIKSLEELAHLIMDTLTPTQRAAENAIKEGVTVAFDKIVPKGGGDKGRNPKRPREEETKDPQKKVEKEKNTFLCPKCGNFGDALKTRGMNPCEKGNCSLKGHY